MAHGFVSYSQPKYGLDLGAMVAGKIKDSFGMAAEERRLRDEEIAKLEGKNKEDRTEEESKRLEELLEQKKSRTTGRKRDRIKNSFFTKAMMSQFGGDRKRRLQGTLSSNPAASQDPSLTKEQRYSALLDESMVSPEEAPAAPDDINPMDYGDANAQASVPQQSGLEKALSRVSEALAIISSKVSSLKAEEAKSKTTTESRLAKFNGVFESIKNYFDKDNDLKKTENDIEKQKIENFRDSQADAKAAREQSAIKGTEDLSNFEDMEERPEGTGKKGFLGGLMDNIGGIFKKFMGGGKKGKTQYTSPIGPQPMNSKGPWASAGLGEMGNAKGFVPRMPAAKLSEGGTVPGKPLKLADGATAGIIDKPTTGTLSPGSSVIPLNRNNALADTFDKAKESAKDPSIADPMAQVMQLPSQVGGGLLIGLLSKAMSALGGIAGMLKPAIQPILNTLVPAFGLPATVAGAIFGGGPAAAATTDGLGFDIGSFFGQQDSKGPGAASSTPTPVGGADLGSSMRAGETIQAQSNEGPGGFIQGGSGKGSEGGQNTSGGYATHYHLSPPSNDAAGWAEARSVALTSAQMMLNRGSSIYFGNIKEFAQPATLADQIAREQQAHTQPGRTQGGIDMQEKSSNGSMRMKFPLKVTNVSQDISGGSGRTARIIGTNVRLAHGAVGSANSVETAANPTTTTPQPVSLGSDPAQPGTTPLTAGVNPPATNPAITAIPALATLQQMNQQQDVPVGLPSAFSLYNPTPGYSSLYGFQY